MHAPEWPLAKVEMHRGVRVEPDERVEGEMCGAHDEGNSEEVAVQGVEDLARSEAHAATDDIAGAKARAKGQGAVWHAGCGDGSMRACARSGVGAGGLLPFLTNETLQ